MSPVLEIPRDRGVFQLQILVRAEDIDEQNHVNNVVYLRWVQEVAYGHWDALGSVELKSANRWVVLRHEIDYHAPALPGDVVMASTWIAKAEGPRQKRYVSIRRIGDNKALASACTEWCLLDAVTGRPKKVTAEITAVFGLKE
jgi:acyl-CoA thioester hydrolase